MHLWWPGMFSDINEHVPTCLSCQRSKRITGKPTGLLQPLHNPQGPWDSLSTDFVTSLRKTKAGFDAILVLVDRLTKYVLIVPTTQSALHRLGLTCSCSMCCAIMAFHWKSFLTEARNLLANTTRLWLIVLQTSWNMSTAFLGQTERMNRTVAFCVSNHD